ncbi:MAG: VPLPA-CTERM-specific exosortase XrtD [Nitrospira sp. CG24A]|nr:MAG: VPLPA-CTERM-specific exosortase XrtD [Nitrospira sp. CG24A]
MKPSVVPVGNQGTPQAASAAFKGLGGSSSLWWSLLGIVVVALLGLIYGNSFSYLFDEWMENEDYGHGIFIPVISLALIWWRREDILAAGLAPTWWGLLPVTLGLGLFIVGELATLYFLQHLSFWLVLSGLILSIAGLSATYRMIFPLGYLLVMIPPPHMLQQSLSSSLQLISSALGVGCLQLVGITAFREGNVIDLGPMQLQVVEACSGLRYLFPLMALTLLCAYLFQDRVWKRVVLVASAIPLAVLLNGLRIGLIGVLVEYFGNGAAEGFMHAFEGWFLFVLSLSLLGLELWLLRKIGQPSSAMSNLFTTGRTSTVSSPVFPLPSISAPVIACVTLLLGITVVSFQVVGREEAPPSRQSFLEFPMHLAEWHGEPMAMERQYVDVLRFDDYLLANYQGPGGPINVYAAYYRSQKSGQATHSPKTCIPGGGWEITALNEVVVPAGLGAANGFRANRVAIQKGAQRQVVLYWFKQRNRLVTSEYLVKFFLLWDGVTMRRSDGALIRLVTAVEPGETEGAADQRVMQMAAAVHPLLPSYVPD